MPISPTPNVTTQVTAQAGEQSCSSISHGPSAQPVSAGTPDNVCLSSLPQTSGASVPRGPFGVPFMQGWLRDELEKAGALK